ncbi:MAG: AAA family ATPase [Acidimicrobiia bacterium]|nr:AAA family ATPase [Acidimicrobiia bacterium]
MSELPPHGLVVAIIGPDGSGKSSLSAELADSLGGERLYFGSGDGSSSWLRWPLKTTRRLVEWIKPPTTTAAEPATTSAGSPPARPPIQRAARALWALTLAREKAAKLNRAQRLRARGRVVVCDRYPQNQVAGINDGPLLAHWQSARSSIPRALARWERRPYDRATDEPPDLVLRLVVSQDVAEQRRPDHDPADLRRRRSIVASLHFDHPTCPVVDIDADRPYEDVLAAALHAVEHRRADAAGLSRTLLVELTGVPGCGKSTRAAALRIRLHAAGVTASEPMARIGPDHRLRVPVKVMAASAEMVRHPGDARRVLLAIIGTRQPTTSQTAKRALNLLAKQHLLRRARRRAGVHLIDEGTIHEVCAVRYRAGHDLDRPVLERALVAPDVVVAVPVDLTIAARRLEQRASRHSRVQDGDHDIGAELSRWRDLVDDEVSRWQDANPSLAVVDDDDLDVLLLSPPAPTRSATGNFGTIDDSRVSTG